MRYILHKEREIRSYIHQNEGKIKPLQWSKRTENRCVILKKNEREVEKLPSTKREWIGYIQQNEREIEALYSKNEHKIEAFPLTKKRSYIQRNKVELKALFPSKRTGNRYVIFNKKELEIREVVLTKTKGK